VAAWLAHSGRLARAGGDFKLSVEHIARRIRRRAVAATIEDGERALIAVLAAVRSAETGARVNLSR
jgi:hypothetical protein